MRIGQTEHHLLSYFGCGSVWPPRRYGRWMFQIGHWVVGYGVREPVFRGIWKDFVRDLREV